MSADVEAMPHNGDLEDRALPGDLTGDDMSGNDGDLFGDDDEEDADQDVEYGIPSAQFRSLLT